MGSDASGSDSFVHLHLHTAFSFLDGAATPTLVHDPDGATTYSASSKRSSTRAATWRASSRKPVLKAGWPQHVCAASNVTSTPSCRKTSTAHSPTRGKNWSPRQVMKSATRGFGLFMQASL